MGIFDGEGKERVEKERGEEKETHPVLSDRSRRGPISELGGELCKVSVFVRVSVVRMKGRRGADVVSRSIIRGMEGCRVVERERAEASNGEERRGEKKGEAAEEDTWP